VLVELHEEVELGTPHIEGMLEGKKSAVVFRICDTEHESEIEIGVYGERRWW